ncbi:hypothetical protein [Wansuia hejianensis]|uniref:Uncharacterized protein n=1 Tax=Wansuia hejianensis TaxID=2763667 RepID=A0A926F0V0_9FIRM|nr:hypothetical protein [Wansuia hejianensis]MBC8589894.1 hypothetical protein [Wansuia hejianensis]
MVASFDYKEQIKNYYFGTYKRKSKTKFVKKIVGKSMDFKEKLYEI